MKISKAVFTDGEGFLSGRVLSECMNIDEATYRRVRKKYVPHVKVNENNQIHESALRDLVKFFTEQLTNPAQAVELLDKIDRAGSRAFIKSLLYNAAPVIDRISSKDAVFMPVWEQEAQLYLQEVKSAHQVSMDELAHRKNLLDIKTVQDIDAINNREFILVDGMKVNAVMHPSKVTLPVSSLTNLLKVHNSPLKASEANTALIGLGFLISGNPKIITKAGTVYGRNQKASSQKYSYPYWFDATFNDLLIKINQFLVNNP